MAGLPNAAWSKRGKTVQRHRIMPPFFDLLMNSTLPPMVLVCWLWTAFVRSPELREDYFRRVLFICQHYRGMVVSMEEHQRFRERLFQELFSDFNFIYQYLLTAGPMRANLHGWRQYYTQFIRRASPAAMAPAPPPPPYLPRPPPLALLPPQPQPLYLLPPLSPISNPTSSETGASTPEGPLDLSTKLASNLLTSDRQLYHHSQHSRTRIQESDDESPADLAQRSPPERTLPPPSNSFANFPSDSFIAPEHFINQSPVNSYHPRASCSSADSRPVHSSESTTTSGHMTSDQTFFNHNLSIPNYQPTTAGSLEHHLSRSLHSGGHLVDGLETRKRGRPNECAEVGTLEPPPKRSNELSLRRSVITFEPTPVRSLEPSTVTENVPNTISFPESRSVRGNEPSTSRSFMTSATSTTPSHTEIENEAPPVQLSEPHNANVLNPPATSSYERSSLRSFKLPGRGSNEPPPAHSRVPTLSQMTWPFPTHPFVSPLALLPILPPPPPATPKHPPTPKPPPRPKPPRMRISPSTITRPPTPQNVLPILPVTQYPAYSPMDMPAHHTMQMPRLPLDYMPLPDPENIPRPHQHRETTSCPFCGVNTHSANNCFLGAEHQRLRKQSRKK